MILMAVRLLLTDLPPDTGPSSAGLPIKGLSTVFGWLVFMALSVEAAGGIWSGAMLVYGHHSSRPDLAVKGKTGLLWAGGGAVMTAIAVPLVIAIYSTARP